MKPHLIIKLNSEGDAPSFNYWEDMITDKRGMVKNFTPTIDRILKKYNLDFFPSNNFQPRDLEWSQSELKNELNKIYRLVLLTNNPDIPQDLINEIRLLPEVDFIKKGEITTSQIPEQTLSGSQSLSSKYVNNSIYLKEAHSITMGHPDVKIAVLDTGIETNHSEFGNQFQYHKDFVNIIDGASQFVGDFLDMDNVPDDLVGHGTHVTGIIGARGRKMPIGVSPKCQIIPVKVLGALKDNNQVVGAGLIDDIDAGIKYAVDQGADVINMSLGIKHEGGGLPHKDIIAYALDSGVSVVAASGNDGKNDKYYPGALKGVIAVGASDYVGNIAPFSTFGGHVSLTAPGVNVYSTFLNNGYAMSSGTSQASPFVSGTIALMKSYAKERGKHIANQEIIDILKHTCDKYTNRYKDEKSGFGRINVLDALKMLQYNL